MKIKLTANKVSSMAVPSLKDGNTVRNRESWMGAFEELLENGLIEASHDDIRVEPLRAGSKLWNWVQPVMSAGGHIVGAPVAPTSQLEAARIGSRVLKGLLDGQTYQSYKPEYALGLLFVLSEWAGGLGRHELGRVIGYAAEPEVEDSIAQDIKSRYLDNHVRYVAIREYLRTKNLKEDHYEAIYAAPSWKEIKKSYPGGCSNKCARYIRRVMVSKFPSKCHKMRTAEMQKECMAPITLGKNAFLTFVETCWRLRGSSISCQIPKRPPAIVYKILEASDMSFSTHENPELYTFQLRGALRRKFQAFERWIHMQHGSRRTGPATWSDTLSKFACSINPRVAEYNKLVSEEQRLLHATSFVPGDLAPEMYDRGRTHTGYFFLGQGFCYAYSAQWRRDAFDAYLKGLFVCKGHCDKKGTFECECDILREEDRLRLANEVSLSDAYYGKGYLLNKLQRIGVSEMQFTTLLRQYYWDGAFLGINLNLLQ